MGRESQSGVEAKAGAFHGTFFMFQQLPEGEF